MNILLKTTFALVLVTLALAGDAMPPGKQGEKSKFALLNSDKSTLNEDDLGTIFQQDLSSLSKSDTLIDDQCSAKLDIALKGAASDANALAFIFTQATEGRLCAMLNQKQSDIDNAAKQFKDTEGFSPVANKPPVLSMPKMPAVAVPTTKPATIKMPDTSAPVDTAAVKVPTTNNAAVVTAAVNVPVTNSVPAVNSTDNIKTASTTNTVIGNVATKTNGADSTVATGSNIDPKIVAAQKAKQDEQMKAAQEAINNLFAQVGSKMNTNAAIPAINFGAAPASNTTAPAADLGAGLARVSVAATPNK